MTPAAAPIPLVARVLLRRPAQVAANLSRVEARGIVEKTPSPWQIALGVLRMWHRTIFRSETIGTCVSHPVRSTWRARLLRFRPLRFPFLVKERAITPFDLSGLATPPWRVVRHLLGAHHDGPQFTYDLELLGCYEGGLEELERRTREVVETDDARSRWLRDLVVYENYHESLLAAVRRARRGELEGDLRPEERDDPDITFSAYLRWCAAQPGSPLETWRAWRRGSFSLAPPAGGSALPAATAAASRAAPPARP